MTEPMEPNDPLPDSNEFDVVKRHYLFPFGRRVKPRRKIPRISRKPGQNFRQYLLEVLIEDGVIYILAFFGLIFGALAAVYVYFPEFTGILIVAIMISWAGSAWVVSKISRDQVATLIEVRMKDRPIRLRNSKNEKGEIVTDFVTEDVTGIALYHFYKWQIGKTIHFENVSGLHGDYGDIALCASTSPDGFTAIGQANYRENITTAMDYFQRVTALTKQQKKLEKMFKKGYIVEEDYNRVREIDERILDLIKKRDGILMNTGAVLQPLDELNKKERQYVLGVKTANEKVLRELEEWEREPGSLKLLRLQRILDNEVLLIAQLEHFIAYQNQHDSDIRNEQHILEQDFRMTAPEDIAARLLDKKKLYKTSRTVFDVNLEQKAGGGEDDRQD